MSINLFSLPLSISPITADDNRGKCPGWPPRSLVYHINDNPDSIAAGTTDHLSDPAKPGREVSR